MNRTIFILGVFIFAICLLSYQVEQQYRTIKQYEHDNATLQQDLRDCRDAAAHREAMLSRAFGEEVGQRPVMVKSVTATAYTARAAECDATPWYTASMTLSRVGVLAVSRDLEEVGLTLGKTVIIKGMGLFRIEDRMNSRWSNRVDILHANLEAARRFAKQDIEILWIGG